MKKIKLLFTIFFCLIIFGKAEGMITIGKSVLPIYAFSKKTCTIYQIDSVFSFFKLSESDNTLIKVDTTDYDDLIPTGLIKLFPKREKNISVFLPKGVTPIPPPFLFRWFIVPYDSLEHISEDDGKIMHLWRNGTIYANDIKKEEKLVF